MRWTGHVARMGEERGVYRVLVGKPEARRPLGRPRSRWVDNIDRVVAELEAWFNRNDLVINAGKTGVMLFHNRQTHVLIKPLVTFNNMNVGLHK